MQKVKNFALLMSSCNPSEATVNLSYLAQVESRHTQNPLCISHK